MLEHSAVRRGRKIEVVSTTATSGTGQALRAREVAEKRASGERLLISNLPPGALVVQVLGRDYVHTVTEEGGDLYLTPAGFRYAKHLQPANWFEPEWFHVHRERLVGTGLTYAVPTRPVDGESLGLVVKYSRVGEKVPIETELIEDLLCCEFNGPFEEFALADELRQGRKGDLDPCFHVQTPLAIYVPPDEAQPSQTGRFEWRIARKVAQHPGIALDILRQYIMVYGWLPGLDAWEAHTEGYVTEQEVRALNRRAMDEMVARGFTMLDMKPAHVIVEVESAESLVGSEEGTRYGIIDFELLERTPERWQELERERREAYRRRRRALLLDDDLDAAPPLPAHIEATRIFGVDYLVGHAESTGGLLWVVGQDPGLLDYYLPERWRTTPQIRLRDVHETFVTTSKDGIPVVWKVSRVGEQPEAAAFSARGFRVLAEGINSPFEEVAAAWWMHRRGLPVALPRAIYRTGHQSHLDESIFDSSRYRSHARLRTPDGDPILEMHLNYITIWDYWNGTDPASEDDEAAEFRTVDLAQAAERGLLDVSEVNDLVAAFRERLEHEGVDVYRLDPEHLLLSLEPDDAPRRDENGVPHLCLCNFLYLRYPACKET